MYNFYGSFIPFVVLFLCLIVAKIMLRGRSSNLSSDLTGKIVIITGSNTGIGKETALDLAKSGATVVMACRDRARTLNAINYITNLTKNGKLVFIPLDLSDSMSVKEFCFEFKKKFDRLDILINNAGMFPLARLLTKDGFEMAFGVNYLGHFLLTYELLNIIKRTPHSRIINLSSVLHSSATLKFDDLMGDKNYFGWNAYASSKLAAALFTVHLANILADSSTKVCALHPGTVVTEIGRSYTTSAWQRALFYLIYPILRLLFKTPKAGAQTTIHCAKLSWDVLVSGGYYDNCKLVQSKKMINGSDEAERLWKESLRLLKLSY